MNFQDSIHKIKPAIRFAQQTGRNRILSSSMSYNSSAHEKRFSYMPPEQIGNRNSPLLSFNKMSKRESVLILKNLTLIDYNTETQNSLSKIHKPGSIFIK